MSFSGGFLFRKGRDATIGRVLTHFQDNDRKYFFIPISVRVASCSFFIEVECRVLFLK